MIDDVINKALPELFDRKDLPDELKEAFKNIHAMGNYWNAQTYSETPKEFIETRKVGRDKTTGEDVYAEYIRQFYVIRELNRLYPGWSVKNYKLWYEASINTWVCTGVLVVRYYDLIDKQFKEREIPGTGAQQVMAKSDDATRPSKPDDMAKSPRTDMIKNCAYWLGIGFDVYSREIPQSMRSEFEELTRIWDSKDIILARAENITRKDDFEKFLKDIPTVKQTLRLQELLERVKKFNPSRYNAVHSKVWEDYQKLARKYADQWLDDFSKSAITNKSINNNEEK